MLEIMVEVVARTEKAILIHEGDKSKAQWVPLSQVEEHENDPVPGYSTVVMPEQLAIEKGFL